MIYIFLLSGHMIESFTVPNGVTLLSSVMYGKALDLHGAEYTQDIVIKVVNDARLVEILIDDLDQRSSMSVAKGGKEDL